MSLNLNLSSPPKPETPDDGATGGKKKKRKLELPIVPIKNTADYQRMKLQRLMSNPDKPVMIPNKPKDKNLPPPPEFVRNVMGSSAGAGSGEFHVYRHLRRKEYARQKCIQESAKLEEEDVEFQRRLEQHKQEAEMKTAKKRAKRMKKKMNAKRKGKGKSANGSSSKSVSSQSDSSDDSDNEEEVIESSSSNNNNESEKSNGSHAENAENNGNDSSASE